jgi:endonuclease/exonuclease/phosphatase family metal-dependent hydrolase
MSANLWSGAADPHALTELVAGLEVDVLAVQELSADQAAAIAEVLPYGLLEPHPKYHGMGIALRRPAAVDHIQMSYRNVRRARLGVEDWPELGVEIEVLNVHVAAPHVGPPGSAFPRRRQQLRQLERYLIDGQEQGDSGYGGAAEGDAGSAQRASRFRQVLVGDLNSTPIWPVYRRLSRLMTDAAVAVAQRRGRPARATWGPWSGSPRLLRIDHGFVRGVEVEEFQVVDLPGSDHSALVLDVVPAD